MSTKKTGITANKYVCECCHFLCSKKYNYDAHILTRKHLINTNFTAKQVKPEFYKCKFCAKEYTSRYGLWYHNKKCTESLQNTNSIEINDSENFKKLILEVIKSNSDLQKQNTELQKQMIEVCKNGNNICNNNNINSNNKTFNLQFFLNEQCKDAMNISEFVNTFDLQLEDLESVGELGYVEGMTKIIVDKLNSMDIYKRPMHCSDAKREIIYVKDENIWAREERTNPKLRQAIKTVTFRNMKQVKKWSDKHPESLDNESHLNDKYMMLVIQSTGGNGAIMDSENKIIRRIIKEIVIGKNI